ncbi:sigma factor [Streptomyces scabiei]|nr:sigma factor [Streptomyces scabiei]MDX2799881.1 sigma factor [Streptomyces scabiei]MDX2858164.1 sigma factor [Streptomyces scabiei]MDX3277859.1 sigma factor [Streptomyces scabiei]MDX3828536.1 sigma factor [Streptomyces scabiei]
MPAITPAQQLNERFTAIYTQFQPHITRLVLHEVRDGNLALAEDLTADAFYRAWLDLHKCTARSDGQMYSWLATLARRTVTAHYRTKKSTEVPVDVSHWSFANSNLTPAASGAYEPIRTGFATARIGGTR